MVLCGVKQYYCNSFGLIGSFNCGRVKPPLGGVLLIDPLGKGLTPMPSMGDRGSS